MTVVVGAAVVAIWSAAIVLAVARNRWIVVAVVALAAAVGTIVAGQAVGGRAPVPCGIMLGVSLFLAAAMAMLGAIGAVVGLLARRET